MSPGFFIHAVKLGKLTKATKVFRGEFRLHTYHHRIMIAPRAFAINPGIIFALPGISGMALPKEFWHPNQFGVRGDGPVLFVSPQLYLSCVRVVWVRCIRQDSSLKRVHA